jgi:hypothetical protein
VPSVREFPLPDDALLARYAARGAFTDCYVADVAGSVSLPSYVEAFYTGRLFKLERGLLGVFVSAPSTDEEAGALAAGRRDRFAAWTVEARTDDQLLMCDLAGRTRSWFRVSRSDDPGTTRLYFGSAVVPQVDRASGRARMSLTFRLLLGFHAVYSRALLSAAAARVGRARSGA